MHTCVHWGKELGMHTTNMNRLQVKFRSVFRSAAHAVVILENGDLQTDARNSKTV